MARPPIPLDTADLVRRYQSGETVVRIARSCKVSHTTIQRHLRQAGVLRTIAESLRKYKRDTMIALPVKEIIARYSKGESPHSIAMSFGVSRTAVCKRLLEAGLLSWRPVRRGVGTSNRRKSLRKRAIAGEKRLHLQGAGESRLADKLERSGFTVRRQAATGRYNVDILLNETIAVEVMTCAGIPYIAKTRFADRLKYLLKRYVMVIVWSIGRHTFRPSGTKKIIALCKKICRNPTTTKGEYWVIWGSGELLVSGDDPNDRAFVPSTVRALNRRRCNSRT